MLIRGDRLNSRQREIVLRTFIYRWTTGNRRLREVYRCPHCNLAKIEFDRIECRQYHPTIRLQTDDEWLATHAFHFLKDGSRLMTNRHHAEPAFMANQEN